MNIFMRLEAFIMLVRVWFAYSLVIYLLYKTILKHHLANNTAMCYNNKEVDN